MLADDVVAAALKQFADHAIHDPDFLAFSRYAAFHTVKCVMDVGSNRGQALISLGQAMPQASYHAFEANPFLLGLLPHIIAQLSLDVTLHKHGLGRDNGKLRFYIPHAGGMTYLEEASTRLDYFDKPWVKDRFAARGGVRLEETSVEIRRGDSHQLAPDVIKLDVEGAEFDVLMGLQSTIAASRPVLLIENSDFENVTPLLRAFDYALFRFDAETGWLVPFSFDSAAGVFTPAPFVGVVTNTFYIPEERVKEILSSRVV